MVDPILLTPQSSWEEGQVLICLSDIAYCWPHKGGSRVSVRAITVLKDFEFKESPKQIYEMIADRALEKEILIRGT